MIAPRRLLLGGLLAGALLLGGLSGCGGAKTAAPPPLTDAQQAKIDPDLRRLLTDSTRSRLTTVPARRRPDSTWTYAAYVYTTDRAALRAAGLPTDSTEAGRVWAWLSAADIRTAARLAAVTRIRADNDPAPR